MGGEQQQSAGTNFVSSGAFFNDFVASKMLCVTKSIKATTVAKKQETHSTFNETTLEARDALATQPVVRFQQCRADDHIDWSSVKGVFVVVWIPSFAR